MASFGENLRRERELRGVDLHDMAEATKISIRFLQALEQDRVDVLPGGIFPRAFVRQYGKYLGLDPERLVAEFVFAHGGETAASRAPAAVVHGDRSRRGWIIAAGGALMAAAIVGWMTWTRPAPEAAALAPAAPSVAPPTFPQDRVYPPPSEATAPPAGVVVGLVVRKRSWVEAKVDGATVLNRIMEEGEAHRLEARSAVTLSLGNAGGVEYTLNGRPGEPLGREGEVRRNVVITADGAAAAAAPLRPAPRPRRPSPSPEAAPATDAAEAPAERPVPAISPGPTS
jgi:transcriptional regulator with XRE-family HTH domain